jgi:hypothetical protein
MIAKYQCLISCAPLQNEVKVDPVKMTSQVKLAPLTIVAAAGKHTSFFAAG